ncbi:MAG: hypothetical protein H6Q67_907 [Firmicutes bacterium]|nr:hypothetical protein [Bacillota bacterium]
MSRLPLVHTIFGGDILSQKSNDSGEQKKVKRENRGRSNSQGSSKRTDGPNHPST